MPKSARAQSSSFFARCFWAAWWIGLLFCGTPGVAFTATGRTSFQIGCAVLFILCCLLPSTRAPRAEPSRPAPRLIMACWHAWTALPPLILLLFVAWLGCLIWSTAIAQLPYLARESVLWQGLALFLAALFYGYAAQGWREVNLVIGGLLAMCDVSLLVLVSGEGRHVWGGGLPYFIFAVTMLPLTWRDAQRAKRHRSGLWHRWRGLRPFAVLGAALFVSPTLLNLKGFDQLWPGVLSLAQLDWLHGQGPGSFALFFPQFIPPQAARLPDLAAPGLLARLLCEQGAPALCVWVLLIGLLLPGNGEDEQAVLCGALQAGVLVFLGLGLFLAPGEAPLLNVLFYTHLALLAALRIGPGLTVRHGDLWPYAIQAPLGHHSPFSKAAVTVLATVGSVLLAYLAPWLVQANRAQWIYEQGLTQTSADDRIKAIRLALASDAQQPVYWAALAEARLERDGPGAARVSASYLRAALHYAMPQSSTENPCPDAALWHRMAQLMLLIGDCERAVMLAKRAVHFDPACGLYHATLAQALASCDLIDEATTEFALSKQLHNNAPAHSPWRYYRKLEMREEARIQ